MNRAIDAVHDRDAVSQPAGVLDLDGDVEQPVPIEVPEFIDRVQLGREHESLSQTRDDQGAVCPKREAAKRASRDRKSTRLNSSHGYISYAVFCLKKKRKRHESCGRERCM